MSRAFSFRSEDEKVDIREYVAKDEKETDDYREENYHSEDDDDQAVLLKKNGKQSVYFAKSSEQPLQLRTNRHVVG